MTPDRTASGRGRPGTTRRRSRKPTGGQPARPAPRERAPQPSPGAAAPPEAPPEAAVSITPPEAAFAARVPPREPERPLPTSRRAIFIDVENASRAEHISRVLDHLAIDRLGRATELVAVGNWKVIGQDTARLLARHGAYLVHSAPSAGVPDWSDLRIAVTAGVWLAAARPGDIVEIISDDRAFDAVGDVAAGLGIAFRRLSYRSLAAVRADGARAPEPEEREPRRRRRRRGGRGRTRGRAHAPLAPVEAAVPSEPGAAPGAEPHTAPAADIIAVVQALAVSGREVTLDALANALKAQGFRRPPGSPRLITRLRRIKEIKVSPTGTITLIEPPDGGEVPAPAGAASDETVAASVESPAAAATAEHVARPRRRRSRGRGRRRQPASVA